MSSWSGYEGCVEILLEAQANVNDTTVSLEPSPPKPLPRGCPLGSSLTCPVCLRTITDAQHSMKAHGGATSRSSSAFSKRAPTRRSETISARRPSTTRGRRARTRSSPSSVNPGTPAAKEERATDCEPRGQPRAVVSKCAPAFACRWRTNGGGSPWNATGSSPRSTSVPSESLHTARASEFLLGCRASAKRRGGRTGSRRRRGGPISALVAAEIGARRPRV